MSPDIGLVAALVREIGREFVLPRFEALEAGDIMEKSPGDLVTIADIEAEAALTPRLAALIPGSVVIGEEAVAKDPTVLDTIQTADWAWVVDPVDGTSNFAAGIPLFATMVALIHRGETVGAWIYDPVKDLMASAERGAGAFAGGKRLSVAPPTDPDQMSGSLSIRFGNRHLVRRIAGRSNLVGSIFNFRCAGQEYLALASGRAHFALYHRLWPWDHAPGQLIHAEAGGWGRMLDGRAYSPRVFDGGLLLAPDEAGWSALHRVLIAGPPKRIGG